MAQQVSERAREAYRKYREFERGQEEAKIALMIQREYPETTRTEALQAAKRILDKEEN